MAPAQSELQRDPAFDALEVERVAWEAFVSASAMDPSRASTNYVNCVDQALFEWGAAMRLLSRTLPTSGAGMVAIIDRYIWLKDDIQDVGDIVVLLQTIRDFLQRN